MHNPYNHISKSNISNNFFNFDNKNKIFYDDAKKKNYFNKYSFNNINEKSSESNQLFDINPSSLKHCHRLKPQDLALKEENENSSEFSAAVLSKSFKNSDNSFYYETERNEIKKNYKLSKKKKSEETPPEQRINNKIRLPKNNTNEEGELINYHPSKDFLYDFNYTKKLSNLYKSSNNCFNKNSKSFVLNSSSIENKNNKIRFRDDNKFLFEDYSILDKNIDYLQTLKFSGKFNSDIYYDNTIKDSSEIFENNLVKKLSYEFNILDIPRKNNISFSPNLIIKKDSTYLNDTNKKPIFINLKSQESNNQADILNTRFFNNDLNNLHFKTIDENPERIEYSKKIPNMNSIINIKKSKTIFNKIKTKELDREMFDHIYKDFKKQNIYRGKQQIRRIYEKEKTLKSPNEVSYGPKSKFSKLGKFPKPKIYSSLEESLKEGKNFLIKKRIEDLDGENLNDIRLNTINYETLKNKRKKYPTSSQVIKKANLKDKSIILHNLTQSISKKKNNHKTNYVQKKIFLLNI